MYTRFGDNDIVTRQAQELVTSTWTNNVNNLQAIVINYFTAGLLAIANAKFNGLDYHFDSIIYSDYLIPSLIIGTLFIITFNLVAFGTQKIGIWKNGEIQE